MWCKPSLYIAKKNINIYLLYSGSFSMNFPQKTPLFCTEKKTPHYLRFSCLVQKSSKNILPNGGKPNAKSKNSPFSQIQEKYKDWSPQSLRLFGLSNDKGAFEQNFQLQQIQSHWEKLHHHHHLGVGFDQHFTTKGSDWLLEKEWCMTSWKTIGGYEKPHV